MAQTHHEWEAIRHSVWVLRGNKLVTKFLRAHINIPASLPWRGNLVGVRQWEAGAPGSEVGSTVAFAGSLSKLCPRTNLLSRDWKHEHTHPYDCCSLYDLQEELCSDLRDPSASGPEVAGWRGLRQCCRFYLYFSLYVPNKWGSLRFLSALG